jgi:hypothetical protein
LAKISFPFALKGQAPAHSLYLAYMVWAYCAVYGHSIESVIAEPYAAKLPELFDGEHDGEAIEQALPAKPREMFQQAFLDEYDHGRPTWLLEALAKNEAFQWTPKAPMRVYFGERDMDVSPEESRAAVAEWTKRGADVELVSVGEYDHEGSIFHAVPLVRRWFDEVRAGKQTASVPTGRRAGFGRLALAGN